MGQISPADPFEIRRDSLLERLDRVRPRIVSLIAPAGFGKTTLARQYLAGRGPWAVCDCSGVRDDLDLARRLDPGACDGKPQPRAGPHPARDDARGRRHEHRRARQHCAGSVARARRRDLRLRKCREASRIALRPARFLARLLSRRPEGRSIVVCSREGLRIHMTRFAAPHEIMTLARRRPCVRRRRRPRIFEPFVHDPVSIERIAAVSQGWPIAVLLLKRFATEGRIDDAARPAGRRRVRGIARLSRR